METSKKELELKFITTKKSRKGSGPERMEKK
jgi:hypothetical protein